MSKQGIIHGRRVILFLWPCLAFALSMEDEKLKSYPILLNQLQINTIVFQGAGSSSNSTASSALKINNVDIDFRGLDLTNDTETGEIRAVGRWPKICLDNEGIVINTVRSPYGRDIYGWVRVSETCMRAIEKSDLSKLEYASADQIPIVGPHLALEGHKPQLGQISSFDNPWFPCVKSEDLGAANQQARNMQIIFDSLKMVAEEKVVAKANSKPNDNEDGGMGPPEMSLSFSEPNATTSQMNGDFKNGSSQGKGLDLSLALPIRPHIKGRMGVGAQVGDNGFSLGERIKYGAEVNNVAVPNDQLTVNFEACTGGSFFRMGSKVYCSSDKANLSYVGRINDAVVVNFQLDVDGINDERTGNRHLLRKASGMLNVNVKY